MTRGYWLARAKEVAEREGTTPEFVLAGWLADADESYCRGFSKRQGWPVDEQGRMKKAGATNGHEL